MKLHARRALWLLPLLLTACTHKSHQAKNQSLAPEIAKPAPPAPTPVELPATATAIPAKRMS